MKTAREILLSKNQSWFSEDANDDGDMSSFISFPDAIQAMKEYAQAALDEAKESAKTLSDVCPHCEGSGFIGSPPLRSDCGDCNGDGGKVIGVDKSSITAVLE